MNLFKKKPDYDLETIEGIMSIKIPKYERLHSIQSPVNNIEYILQRKATEHKKNGRMDLAIACLRKSNELMPYSNFSYTQKDYMRLINYLKKEGRLEEATSEEENIKRTHPELWDKRLLNKTNISTTLNKAKSYGEDLVTLYTHPSCPICGKYNGKILSISGKSRRYNKIPIEFINDGGFCKDCLVSIGIKFKGIN